MKLNSKIYDIVRSGKYIGDNKPCGRITIEPDWVLQTTDPVYDGSVRGPFRYYQDAANTQVEIEVPNIKSIQIERSLSQDIATCSIQLYNQWHDSNSGSTILMTPELANQLGKPGYFWPKRGESLESQNRWNQEPATGAYDKDGIYDPSFDWSNVIVPNGLIRTYQGYGGHDVSIQQALDDDNIMLTGIWLIDTITGGTDGMLNIQCRDVGRLLLEQIVYPPLVPKTLYPLEYRTEGTSPFDSTFGPDVRGVPIASFGEARAIYSTSAVDQIFGSANYSISGHRGSHASDGNMNTFALSPAVNDPMNSSGYYWWEFDVEKPGGSGRQIQGLSFTTWGGGYTAYISIRYDGPFTPTGWFGTEVVPGGVSPVTYIKKVNIPLMPQDGNERETSIDLGIPNPEEVYLPEATSASGWYRAHKIRITLGPPLIYSGIADNSGNQYRCGLKDVVFRAVGRSVGEFAASGDEMPWTYAMDSHPVRGYWVLERSGYVHGFGDAADYDSTAFGMVNIASPPYYIGGQPGIDYLPGQNGSYQKPKAISLAAHPSGEGYWILDATGRVYAFGAAQQLGWFDVPHRGDPGGPWLGVSAVDMAATYTGNGYWVLYSDGSVRGFGDATPGFSQVPWTAMTSNMVNSGRGYKYLYYDNNPLGFLAGELPSAMYAWARRGTAIAAHPKKIGFWVTSGSGEIFPFGDVGFFGQMTNRTYNPGGADEFVLEYNHWPHGLVSTKTGNGYWIAFTNGRIAAYGDAVNQGVSYIYQDNPQILFVADGNFPTVDVFQQLVWDVARDPDGKGFWVLIANGSVRSYEAKNWGMPGYYGKSGFRWKQGNFKEYYDIVKDLLAWSGFTLYDSTINSIIEIPVTTNEGVGIINPGDSFVVDDYTLLMQTDGNLVLGTGNLITVGGVQTLENTVWSTGTFGNPGAFALWQGDGNLVVYEADDPSWAARSSWVPLWWTRTEGNFGAKLVLRYDGFFGIVSDQGADLWTGYIGSPDPIDRPAIFGNIESTGIFTDNSFPADKFDKRTVLDCINEIKQVVGYNFFIDQDGGARFESPNWWSAGNFDDLGQKIYVTYDENGSYTRVSLEGATPPEGAELFVPEIDEAITLKSYQANISGDNLRSEIIIGSDAPDPNNPKATSYVRFTPPSSSDEIRPGVPALRNIVRPALWIDNTFKKKEEQETMAELIGLQIWFSQRTGSLSCVADPNIQINDQIKIVERNTSETYIHYVRGISTSMDLDTGAYEMSITTNWLGNESDWVITSSNIYNPITHVSITEKIDRWQAITGRGLEFSGLGQKPVVLTGKFV